MAGKGAGAVTGMLRMDVAEAGGVAESVRVTVRLAAPAAVGVVAASVKVPSPFPRRTLTVLELELATTRSAKESVAGFKSAVTIAEGPVSAALSTIGEFLACAKLPDP